MTIRTRRFNDLGETLCEAVLPNGLRLAVLPKPDFASCYAVFATDYGGAHRRFTLGGESFDTPAGVAHYLEHKMFDLPNGDNAMDLLAANGADPNAFTSAGMTAYFFLCTEKFEENLRLLLHFVSTPYFTEETVQKERGIIEQEILMGEDDPGSRHYYDFLKMLYARHPVRDQVAGTVESIRAITPETLHACHRAFYAPGNMALVVEGPVDPARVLAIAEEELGTAESAAPAADFGEEESLLPCERFKLLEMPVSAPQFLIGAKFRPEAGGTALLRQRLVSQLALRVLFGASSPFYTELYAAGLLNRDYSYEAMFTAGTGTLLIGGESRDPQAVFDALQKVVEGVRANGLDAKRFERARRASYGSRLRGFEDFESVCLSTASGLFRGYCALEAPRLLSEIGRSECEAFLCEALAPERLALAVLQAKKE